MNWHRLPRPWNKEQCRRRYVEGGDNIGLRALAEISGQSKGNLERWSRKHGWVDQRGQFIGKMNAAVQEKIIEKTSEKLSKSLSDIAISITEIHSLESEYFTEILQIKKEHLNLLKLLSLSPSEESEQRIKILEELLTRIKKFHAPHEVNQLSQALGRSTQGIAMSTGLQYFVNGNASYRRVESDGFIILSPSDSEGGTED